MDVRADKSHTASTDDIDTHDAAARASVRSVAGHGQVQAVFAGTALPTAVFAGTALPTVLFSFGVRIFVG